MGSNAERWEKCAMNFKFHRGDVWDVNFEPVRGHEQGERRPALIVSYNGLNHSNAELVIVVPLTSKRKQYVGCVEIPKGEISPDFPSYALCDQIRAISIDRIGSRKGTVSVETLDKISDVLFRLLDLEEKAT